MKRYSLTWAVIWVSFAVLFSSCASMNDVSINKSFDNMATEFHKQQSIQVSEKSKRIAEMATYECTGNAADCGAAMAFSKVLGYQAIGAIEAQEFKMARPKTGVDVQSQGIDQIDTIVTGGVALGAIRFVSENQPTTTYNNKGDVVNSGNRTDSHTTTAGDGNTGLSSGANKDKDDSVETVTDDHSVQNGGV